MIIAIDIGGTTIKYAIMSNHQLGQVFEEPSKASQGAEILFTQIVEIIERYHNIKGIAIATAGQVDALNGVITYAGSTIPGYTGFQLSQKLECHFGVDVYIENDVNCAIYSEVMQGQIQDDDWYVGLTIGTGIGGAVITNQSLLTGSCHSIGEFGYLPVKGHPFETIASTTALVHNAKLVDPSIQDGIGVLSRLNQPLIKQVFDDWIDDLVEGLCIIAICFNPKLMILGGGILNARDIVFEAIKQAFEQKELPPFIQTKIVPTTYYNDAGIIGAYSLFRKHKNENN